MELRHLRYFVAVAEELSFSAAARRLHIAQPPLSVQIKQLEDELGTSLFERTSRRVRLTSVGELFLSSARQILRESAAAVHEAQRAGRGEVGRLRVSFSGNTLTYDPLLPEILRAYRSSHPTVDLVLHERAADQQLQELLADQVDAAFLGLSQADLSQAASGELATSCLLMEPLFVVLPEGHPLAVRRRLHPRQLEAEPLVWGARQGVFLREGGTDLEGRGLEVNSIATVFNYVAAGFGISILPRQYTGFAVRGVCFVPYVHPRPFRYGMAWRRTRGNSQPLASFLACTEKIARLRYAAGKEAKEKRRLGAVRV